MSYSVGTRSSSDARPTVSEQIERHMMSRRADCNPAGAGWPPVAPSVYYIRPGQAIEATHLSHICLSGFPNLPGSAQLGPAPVGAADPTDPMLCYHHAFPFARPAKVQP
ncbi:MAG: hypothetical protein Kow0022_15210 [Phycisphaerales bacterium]